MAEQEVTVEAAYRAWIATLGTLSPRQQAEAAHLFRLCAELDLQSDRPAAALAALSRAIAKTADRLRDEKNATNTSPGAPESTVAAEPDDVVVSWAEQRAKRVGGNTA